VVFARPERWPALTPWIVVGALLAGASSTPSAENEAMQEAVLRTVAAQDTSGYFLAYCVAAIPGQVPPAKTREERVETVWVVDPPDAPSALLTRLADLPHRFLGASACIKKEKDHDIVLRATNRGPALSVTIGPVQRISENQAEIVVITTSAFLTETTTAYSLRRSPDGTWRVTKEEILLQA
jgi:hypothetical protein